MQYTFHDFDDRTSYFLIPTTFTMPTESSFPKLNIPNIDLWAFLFERKDRPFPDNKGMFVYPFSGQFGPEAN
jgi:hypothetical protein